MQNSAPLVFTGERYVPGISGNIELEHMHRYIYALAYAEGKTILDVASGEGYGTALLASRATFVIGVDIAADAIAHAKRNYRLSNLEFRLGSCSKIPLEDGTVDFVVSFETIEHHDEHDEMLREIKRVLRPGGVVLVSSPDKALYTDKPDYHNPFHVQELYKEEFETLFRRHFKNVASLGQKVMFGSAIVPIDGAAGATSADLQGATSTPGLSEALYNLVVASDAALPAVPLSFLDVGIDASDTVKHWRAVAAQRDGQIQRLESELQAAHGKLQTAQGELQASQSELRARQAELQATQGELQTARSDLDAARNELQAVWKQFAIATSRVRQLSADIKRSDARSILQFLVERKKRARTKSTDSDIAIILRSPFFDAEWYLERYPDVANSDIEPATHYDDFGWREGRQPGPLFDGSWYLQRYPDVREAAVNPLVHYMKFGWSEGRPIHTSASGRVLNMPMDETNALSKVKTIGQNILTRARQLYRELPAASFAFPIEKISPDRETVIVMAHEASRTGAPILAWNLIEELRRRYNVVALLKRGGAIEQAFRDSAAAVVCLPDNFPLQGRELQDLVGRLIKTYSPIYAIANSVETRDFVPEIEKMGVPVVALAHEFSCYTWPAGILNSLFQTASQIVFSTRVTAENAVRDYRSLEVRDFRILPQGPSKLPPSTNPSAATAPAKTDIKGLWPKDSKDLLLVVGMGAIQIRKGLDFFVSAAATVHRALPNREIRFAWVGKCYSYEHPYLEYLKEQIARSGLSDAFAFVDEVDDLQPIYDQADIFFLSSRLDPLPNVAIDAALNGIPVICFDQASGMAEILAEAVDTRELVLPHTDAGAAAQLICDLARDPARLANLSKAIRAVAEARFDMTRYVEAIDELGRNAKAACGQVKRDHALISKNNAFNTDLYLGVSANALSADEGLSKYLNTSRLAAPRHRPRTGLLLKRPLEGFNPLIYASDNPQFDEVSGEDPLAHYIRTGRPSGRWTHQVVRPGVRQPATGTALRVAIHGHFHYPELLPDFIKRLRCNTTAVDLYLTTTSAAKAEELSGLIAAAHFERTKIIVVPNRGRDIGAMLSELGESLLSGYDIVGHFHGKRSPQFDTQFGERWRSFLWEHLIGGEFAMLDVVQAAFAEDGDLGLVFAEDPHLNDWDDNRAYADRLAQRIGLTLPLPNHFDFPIGSMFWARTAALKPLFDLRLAWEDYPEEPLPGDGTILHALERLLPFSAEKAGFRYATTYVKSAMR